MKRFVIENGIWYVVESEKVPPFPSDLPPKIQKLVDKHDPKEVKMGYKVEFEHNKGATDVVGDPIDSLKIALAHLDEDPKYYTHLAAMEDKYVKESPDKIYVGHGERKKKYVTDYRASDAYSFGFDGNIAYVSPRPGLVHWELGKILMDPDLIGDSDDEDVIKVASEFEDVINYTRDDFDYAGRLWEKSKIISFWEYPPFGELKKVLKSIEKEFNRINMVGKKINIMQFKIEIPSDNIIDSGPVAKSNSYGTDDVQFNSDGLPWGNSSYSDVMSSSSDRKVGGADWDGGGYLYLVKNVLKPNFNLKGQGKGWKKGGSDIQTNKDIQHQVAPMLKKGKISKLSKDQQKAMWDYFKGKGNLGRDEKRMWKMLSRHMGVKEDRTFLLSLIKDKPTRKAYTMEEGTGILTEAPHIEVGNQVIDLEFEQGKIQGMRRILRLLVGLEVEDKYGSKMKLSSPKEVQEFLKKIAKNTQVKKEL